MQASRKVVEKLENGGFSGAFSRIYPKDTLEYQKQRYIQTAREFESLYGEGRDIAFFSAPGRTEIGGNHTDHQRGRVLAASVNLDVICAVSVNNENIIRIKSEGHKHDIIDLDSLSPVEDEKNHAASLIRGISARFLQLGYKVGGFDAYTISDVLKGSGLSSSAAFEVAVGTILSHLFNSGAVSAVEIAQIGQYAENVYFGKPCGLMDQTASSVGGFVTIDFKDPERPVVEPVAFDFASSGHVLCIVDTKGSHSDLTGEYAAIPKEMGSVAQFFGQDHLRGVDEREFYDKLPELREKLGDRPVLRAMHFFGDNARVTRQVEALRCGDFDLFKKLVVESGRSSYEMLQNVFAVSAPNEQGVSVALAISERLLSPKGAWRVHGGGFAGTIQAFVPVDMLEDYRSSIEKIFGQGSCHELTIRPAGGIRIEEDQ